MAVKLESINKWLNKINLVLIITIDRDNEAPITLAIRRWSTVKDAFMLDDDGDKNV